MLRRGFASRAVVALLVAAIASGIGLALWRSNALGPAEDTIVDAHFRLRPDPPPPRGVAWVGIDDQDIRTFGFPLPRSAHAVVIKRLLAAGARVVAYDVQFSEPLPGPDDAALRAAIAQARGRLVLGTTLSGNGAPQILPGLPRGTVLGLADFGLGGGIYRRLPYARNGVPTLAVAAAVLATGRPVPRAPFADGGAPIDYSGPPDHVEEVPFSNAYLGRFGAVKISGRVVVVGFQAKSADDLHPTPISDGLMAGAEIHANAIATALAGFPLREASDWVVALLIVLLAVGAPLSAARTRGIAALAVAAGVGLALAGGLLVGSQLAFDDGHIVPVTYGLIADFVAVLGTTSLVYVTEIRVRRRQRAVFERFVPRDVVNEVLDRAGDDLRLGGTRRVGTVMFCDLRGFTALAEALPAESVIELLNRYLTLMSDAILDEGGTLVSYMGDGIMAVFGAPLEQADHADRALRAAAEMIEHRLPRFNAWLRDEGLRPVGADVRMGIGISSGEMMSGNVGSARRLEYAAVGDTTNVAARLEAHTRETGHDVLVADATLRAASGDRWSGHAAVEVGDVTLRGRSQAIRVWTITPSPSSGEPAAIT